MSNLLDQVRTSCRDVAESGRFVRINLDRLEPYAASLSFAGLPTPTYDLRYHYRGSAADTIAFVLTLDAINFGSGYFPHLAKRPGLSGYFTIAAALTDSFAANGPFTPADLQQLTSADCAGVFGQQPDNPVAMELMALFAQALNELGRYLDHRLAGDYTRLLAEANGSAATLVRLLARMPFFQDVAGYDGREVAFYKRAQITVADLALAFDQQGPGEFHDLDRLTMFADNLVPHVLRIDGLLDYNSELAARIEHGELIPAGSPEEIEIRAVALDTVERLVAILRAAGQPVTAMALDNLLWYRGGEPIYKSRPRHRTRTVFY